ncbi:MAG: dihydroorotase [Candidatus Kapaibacterium sp.]
MNILFKNIRIVSPADNLKGKFDLSIRNGFIEYIEIPGNNSAKDYDEIINGEYLTAVPGFYDMHVHFRDPGQTEKEDIESGVLSAANGGFTGVLCMPNTKPPIDNKKIITYILKKAEDMIVDVHVSACASKNREGNEIANLKELHNAGALAFTDDGSPLLNTSVLSDTLKYSAEHAIPFLQHAENYKLSGKGVVHKGKVSKELQIEGIPYESETLTVKNDIELANKIDGSKYHVQHISCGDTVDLIRTARINNKNISCEACPHHFILTDEIVKQEGSNAKMNPPLREKTDIDKILAGIKDDTIQVICTDHAPHTSAEKAKGISNAPFGIVGLESCIGLSYTYLVEKDIISFESLIKKMSDNPRRILNLPRISVGIGEKANLTILETNLDWVINTNKFKSKSKNSPFNGFQVKCKPFGIYNNNKFFKSQL